MPWYYHAATATAKPLDDGVYESWIAAGNPKAAAYTLIPDPPAPGARYDGEQWQVYEPTIEQKRAALVCSPRQARLALQQAGMLSAVTAWIAQADEATQIEWEYATEIRRNHAAITGAATALGLSDAQIDTLFETAMQL